MGTIEDVFFLDCGRGGGGATGVACFKYTFCTCYSQHLLLGKWLCYLLVALLSNGFQILPLPSYLCKVKHHGGATPKIMVHSHLMFKLVLNENLGGILGGTQCQMGDSLMLSKG